MPCWTISTVSVEWDAERTDINLLKEAINSLKLFGNIAYDGKTIVFAGGKFANNSFTFEGLSAAQAAKKVAEIKRSYSEQVVLSQAKAFGWKIKKVADYEYEVIKQ